MLPEIEIDKLQAPQDQVSTEVTDFSFNSTTREVTEMGGGGRDPIIAPQCLWSDQMWPAFQKISDLQVIAWQILGQNTWFYAGKRAKDTRAEFSQADRFKYFQYIELQLMSKQNNLVGSH